MYTWKGSGTLSGGKVYSSMMDQFGGCSKERQSVTSIFGRMSSCLVNHKKKLTNNAHSVEKFTVNLVGGGRTTDIG